MRATVSVYVSGQNDRVEDVRNPTVTVTRVGLQRASAPDNYTHAGHGHRGRWLVFDVPVVKRDGEYVLKPHLAESGTDVPAGPMHGDCRRGDDRRCGGMHGGNQTSGMHGGGGCDCC